MKRIQQVPEQSFQVEITSIFDLRKWIYNHEHLGVFRLRLAQAQEKSWPVANLACVVRKATPLNNDKTHVVRWYSKHPSINLVETTRHYVECAVCDIRVDITDHFIPVHSSESAFLSYITDLISDPEIDPGSWFSI